MAYVKILQKNLIFNTEALLLGMTNHLINLAVQMEDISAVLA